MNWGSQDDASIVGSTPCVATIPTAGEIGANVPRCIDASSSVLAATVASTHSTSRFACEGDQSNIMTLHSGTRDCRDFELTRYEQANSG